jgi:hypothetical protein
MADNTTLPVGAGGDTISTDELATLNGVATTVQKAQRVKAGFGTDGVFRDVSAQFPLPADTDSKRNITFIGRSATFRTPGRAGTAGQKIFSIFNAVGSAVLVDVDKLTYSMAHTVVKAVTVLPPAVRLYRITALPTGGTAGQKIARNTTQTSAAAVTTTWDASGDGTNSAVALAAVITGGTSIAGFFAPRIVTAVGYLNMERIELLDSFDERITLQAGQGLVMALDYTLATQNPITDMHLAMCRWTEYTAA